MMHSIYNAVNWAHSYTPKTQLLTFLTYFLFICVVWIHSRLWFNFMTIVTYFQHVPFCSEANNSIDSNLCTLLAVGLVAGQSKEACKQLACRTCILSVVPITCTSEIFLAFYWCHMLPSCMSEYMLKPNYCAVGNTTCMLLYLVAQLE